MNTLNNLSNNKELTPTRRLGLSRKRSSVVLKEGQTAKSTKTITKQRKASPDTDDTTPGTQCEPKDYKNIPQNMKYCNLIEENTLNMKIRELEDLFSLWKASCKTSLFYLIKLIEDRQSEIVNVKKLLQELRIFGTMKFYFVDDSDFDCFTSDSEN